MTSPSTVPPEDRTTICVVGAGYVGLTAAACFAALGHRVRCVESDPDRLASLRAGVIPIHEPGLAELVAEGRHTGRLAFTDSLAVALPGSSVALLCVGTPPRPDGHPDLRQVASAAAEVARAATGDLVVAVKSTVPPGTGEALELVARDAAPPGVEIHLASNPEFLRESRAVEDFFHPDRVVVGAEDPAAAAAVARLYPSDWPMLRCDRRSAELVKYASNTFLAVKISFANEVAGLCEQAGADATAVLAGVGMDERIGESFLGPGPGFGGSCLGKDLSGLVAAGAALDSPTPLARAAMEVNGWARSRVVDRLRTALGDLTGVRVAVLGLAFKPGTSDTRDSPAVDIVRQLLAEGAVVASYDPLAVVEQPRHDQRPDVASAVTGAEAVVIATGWPEFALLEPGRLAALMAGHLVVDAVGAVDPAAAEAAGLEVFTVGRGSPHPFRPVVIPPLEWCLDVALR